VSGSNVTDFNIVVLEMCVLDFGATFTFCSVKGVYLVTIFLNFILASCCSVYLLLLHARG
jgi:hypothetical protein